MCFSCVVCLNLFFSLFPPTFYHFLKRRRECSLFYFLYLLFLFPLLFFWTASSPLFLSFFVPAFWLRLFGVCGGAVFFFYNCCYCCCLFPIWLSSSSLILFVYLLITSTWTTFLFLVFLDISEYFAPSFFLALYFSFSFSVVDLFTQLHRVAATSALLGGVLSIKRDVFISLVCVHTYVRLLPLSPFSKISLFCSLYLHARGVSVCVCVCEANAANCTSPLWLASSSCTHFSEPSFCRSTLTSLSTRTCAVLPPSTDVAETGRKKSPGSREKKLQHSHTRTYTHAS